MTTKKKTTKKKESSQPDRNFAWDFDDDNKLGYKKPSKKKIIKKKNKAKKSKKKKSWQSDLDAFSIPDDPWALDGDSLYDFDLEDLPPLKKKSKKKASKKKVVKKTVLEVQKDLQQQSFEIKPPPIPPDIKKYLKLHAEEDSLVNIMLKELPVPQISNFFKEEERQRIKDICKSTGEYVGTDLRIHSRFYKMERKSLLYRIFFFFRDKYDFPPCGPWVVSRSNHQDKTGELGTYKIYFASKDLDECISYFLEKS